MRRYRSRFKPFSVRRSERKAKNRLLLSIILIVIFAFALLSWILPTLIGGLSFLNQFKTVKKEVVIEDPSLAPPVLNIPFEATNSSVIKVKGYAQPLHIIEIYLDDNLESSPKSNSDGTFISESINLSLGSNYISGKTLDDQDKKSLSSKPIKIFYDPEEPKLEISSPADNDQTKDKRINVTGYTDPKDTQVLTVNDQRAVIDSEGKFSHQIELNDGENRITIVATDSAGNSTNIQRLIIYAP